MMYLCLFFQEEQRARDLFFALWVPDLFMKRVQSDASWSLFCPNEAPGLADCWGDEFEMLYSKYEIEVFGMFCIEGMHDYCLVMLKCCIFSFA